MFLHLSVSHSVHRVGVSDPVHADNPREQTPPHAVHAGKYGQQAGGTHPTVMHTCLKK